MTESNAEQIRIESASALETIQKEGSEKRHAAYVGSISIRQDRGKLATRTARARPPASHCLFQYINPATNYVVLSA